MAKTEKTVDCSSIEGKNGGESMKNNYEGRIQCLKLNQLVDFKDHPFKVETDTALFELMQSIEKRVCWFLCLQDQIQEVRAMN